MVTVAAAHVTSTAGYCPGVGLHYTVTFTSNNQYYYKIQFIEYNFLNIHNDTDMKAMFDMFRLEYNPQRRSLPVPSDFVDNLSILKVSLSK